MQIWKGMTMNSKTKQLSSRVLALGSVRAALQHDEPRRGEAAVGRSRRPGSCGRHAPRAAPPQIGFEALVASIAPSIDCGVDLL